MKIDSLILKYVVRLLFFVVNLFAIYLFLRGHNNPGGGFIAGLISGLSILLLAMSFDFETIQNMLRWRILGFCLVGLTLSYGTAFLPTFFGKNFFKHTMWHWHWPLIGDIHLGTPFFFDLGVYFVVVGVVVSLIFTLVNSMQKEGIS